MGLKKWRHTRRQRCGSANADPALHIMGCPLEKTVGFQLHFEALCFMTGRTC